MIDYLESQGVLKSDIAYMFKSEDNNRSHGLLNSDNETVVESNNNDLEKTQYLDIYDGQNDRAVEEFL